MPVEDKFRVSAVAESVTIVSGCAVLALLHAGQNPLDLLFFVVLCTQSAPRA